MYTHLTARPRQVVTQLVKGRKVEIGGAKAGPLGPEQQKALSLLAMELDPLSARTGQDMGEAFVEKLGKHECPEDSASLADEDAPVAPHWRLGTIRTHSFRGLAPAGQDWEHDFEGLSHLIFGPNGCGKSSLLGAVAWCLTGLVFRDDCPPAQPEDIPTYTTAPKASTAGVRPDALALMDAEGRNPDSDEHYWVDVELLPGIESAGLSSKWLRRHSTGGLSISANGQDWTQVNGLSECGIAELDAELCVAMPARVSHIRFGKDKNLLALFAQLVGLDDLERITDLAARTQRAINTSLNKLRRTSIPTQQQPVEDAITVIEGDATDSVRCLSSYAPALANDRNTATVAAFGKELSNMIDAANRRLAVDLGLTMPAGGTPERDSIDEQLKRLPGQVDGALKELRKPLSEVMPTSLGLTVPSQQELDDLVRRLDAFEKEARAKATERINWAIQEDEDQKAALMLAASAHFPDGSRECPVCTQDLEPVPEVKKRLSALRLKAGQPHLRQKVDDLERALLAQLEGLLPKALQQQGAQSLAKRLLADWSQLKNQRFPDLLAGIAEGFNERINRLLHSTEVGPVTERPRFAAGFAEEYHDAFPKIDEALGAASRYVRLMQSALQHTASIGETIEQLLKPRAQGGGDESLCEILQRGTDTSDAIRALGAVQKGARSLGKAQKQLDSLKTQAQSLEAASDTLTPIKALAPLVQGEVVRVVQGVEPRMKELYGSLYKDELLELDMVTCGHPANPGKRDEINAYLRAGEQRVPVAPFSNSGRFRALALSFVFALLENSRGTLDLLILDDPALSLDDDHMARFVDSLVSPLLDRDQVILATHYETFRKIAEPALRGAKYLQLHPRPRAADAVGFEPGDLLHRVEQSLSESGGSWREKGINLRRWVERTLKTLSGYCPKPFFVFNNISDSIRGYEKVADRRVATSRRDEIITALRSPEFERVMHRIAHDEDPTQPEVRDAHTRLAKCQKAVQKEIEHFKMMQRHSLLGRALTPRLEVAVISIDSTLAETEIRIVTEAAAARGGMANALDEESIERIAACPVGILRLDTLQPIARQGQFLLLDPKERAPIDGDLVVAETESGDRYARRLWQRDGVVCLQAQNATPPNLAPVIISDGICSVRRIIGVVYRPGEPIGPGEVASEWSPADGNSLDLIRDAVGVRIKGTSMEPVGWDGQVALIRKCDNASAIPNGILACVDIYGEGAVIKRCYPSDRSWELCSVNVSDPQAPMKVAREDICNVYPLIGVVFEIPTDDAGDV